MNMLSLHTINNTLTSTFGKLVILLLVFFSVSSSKAQIIVGGNIYGGGNEGNVGGSTSVTVRAGDLNKVYGGARIANVAGNSYVNIDGEHASNYILINYVYGGNDIAGTIGTNLRTFDLPASLTKAAENNIDGSWNAFVRISSKTATEDIKYTAEEIAAAHAADPLFNKTTDDVKIKAGDVLPGNKPIYIGQLFGGGNGEYYYKDVDENHNVYESEEAYNAGKAPIISTTDDLFAPALKKTYLEIMGGSIVYAYGGGNNATITDRTMVYLDNPSNVVYSIKDITNPHADTTGELLHNTRLENLMGINTTFSYPNSDAYQIGRLFGGNNKADMAIRPRWNLQRGAVRDLYGGGNEGRMTSHEGLLLQVEGSGMKIDNVYGGCRKADVHPLYDNDDNRPVPYADIQLDPSDNPGKIPGGYAARVRILGGDVNNVYGGNDISGNVYGGNTVGIFTTIHGNVYGGGNGSYAYTDNAKLAADPRWHDLYYDPNKILGLEGDQFTSLQSAEALNIFRPNAETVSILVKGTEAKPVVVEGALYVGGNSASLRTQTNRKGSASEQESSTHLKIGSYVTIDKVFLGNNGENMIKYNEAEDAVTGRGEGVLRTLASTKVAPDGTVTNFSKMKLTDATTFAKYMEGCAMKVKPNVLFESTGRGDLNDYIPYSTLFGSFYCGGNVGSILVPGKITVDFNHEVIIYDKLVGGCNNAKVKATELYNAEYIGGLIGDYEGYDAEQTNQPIGDKLELNLSGLTVEPKRWTIDSSDGHRYLEWNTYIGDTPVKPITENERPTSVDNPIHANENDMNRRLVGGNIYGGCYTSGVVNGNVTININSSIIDRERLFDKVAVNSTNGEDSLYHNIALGYTDEHYHILQRRTGVVLNQQGIDVFGKALNIFGGGKGVDTEIWGSTTVNMNRGYAFQIFGGSEEGVIGKSNDGDDALTYEHNNKTYKYNPAYSCHVNLKGAAPGVSLGSDYNSNMPECEFLYGGSYEGLIVGNSVVNLGNGRVFNSFAGSCDADIMGHTETYIGYHHQIEDEKGVVIGEVDGFPFIRDMVYGGNNLGGKIMNSADFSSRLRTYDSNVTNDINNFDIRSKIYKTNVADAANPHVVKASAYIEYNQGYADAICGGHYGTYDYSDSKYVRDDTRSKPYMENSFVNFRPMSTEVLRNPNKMNIVNYVYGGSQGISGDFDSNKMQNGSYVLVDIPQDMSNYKSMKVFGAGAWGGLGMGGEKVESNAAEIALDKKSAIIDLMRGQIDAVYGASHKTGFTRRTVVNVPDGSTIHLNNIFGGGYGDNISLICDAYEANVNYNSADAIVEGAIYGGNNAYRRTLYGRVNISSPVYTGQLDNNNIGKYATVYGAGYGANTWSQYTEVNLKNGAKVAEVYGGGQAGMVMNKATVEKWKPVAYEKLLSDYQNKLAAWNELSESEKDNNNKPSEPKEIDLSMGENYSDLGLDDPIVKSNILGIANETGKFNTNVYIYDGAVVDVNLEDKASGPAFIGGYAYAGGYGYSDEDGSGDVYGTTYIGLFGGEVKKDIYAGGTVGSVMNRYVPKTVEENSVEIDNQDYFVAGTYAYIEGGTARNVYGGGWQGSVGKHQGATVMVNGNDKYLPIAGETEADVLGETHVVIGIRNDLRDEQKPYTDLPSPLTYTKGVPAIQRNAYSGGEGGAVFGTANLIINNGYIGYVFEDKEGENYTNYHDHYKEKLDDETWFGENPQNRLEDCGNAFGGGYDDLSSVDFTNIRMYGGIIRNSLHGGGEIATIGRGTTKQTTGVVRDLDKVFKNGKTHIELYNGHVLRNVFGGGKGYNKLKYGLGHELYTDGYVFGQTEVYIHGGEIGTHDGIAKEYGNVFGGGDIGYVYSSAYSYTMEHPESTGSPGHVYYKKEDGSLTEDCKVVVSPYLQVKPGNTISYQGKEYQAYDYMPTEYLNTLGKKKYVETSGVTIKQWPAAWNQLITEEIVNDAKVDRGVMIHNAVFGGGNVSANSDKTYANATTVYGNVTATLYDAFHRDFITIGTEHTGGLYGGGNFSMVDGYRELNITNYGTDYFSMDQQIDLATYRSLTNRERAYFRLKYECKEANKVFKKDGEPDSRAYALGEKIDEDVYLKLLSIYGTQVESVFTPFGICSIYAGRLLNTIQRADFCGVFGSRMVLQGAKDRVADTEQNMDYTINRIGELSLNKKKSIIASDMVLKPNPISDEDYANPDDAVHGNYFGIYSVVNYLGNLTSDQHFDDAYEGAAINTKVEPNLPYQGDGKTTYYSYKADNSTSSIRNLAECPHQVALASGVHLELINESEDGEEKNYGYITGIVGLDLINVKKDKVMGGGFVYAKNEHRVPKYFPNKKNVLLSEYNQQTNDEAITYKRFCYTIADEPTNASESANSRTISGSNDAYSIKTWQTSGNFIHNTKHIVDDCYPTNNAYDPNRSPYSVAHYWYVKGEVYLYDQVISAYTGSATAYHKESQLNLTITAASNGRLQLLNVKPNLYAYRMPTSATDATPVKIGTVKDADDNTIDHVTVNNEHDSYKLNDVITWWDWHQLNEIERSYFVTNTYVNCVDCKVNGVTYKAGSYVMDDTDFNAFKHTSPTIRNTEGEPFLNEQNEDVGLSYVFRSSNNISHDQGYVLTLDMNTPTVWDKYYTKENPGSDRVNQTNQNGGAGYLSSPTYYPQVSGVYGIHNYQVGDIITKSTVEAYTAGFGENVKPAYVATNNITYTSGEITTTANAGSTISQTVYDGILNADQKANFSPAYVSISTVKLADGVYLGKGEIKSASQIAALKTQYGKEVGAENENTKLKDEIDAAMKEAYICVQAGNYGGQQYERDRNYNVIDAWCGLSKEDRDAGSFTFNQDAFDLLSSPEYLNLSGANSEKYPEENATRMAYGTTYSQKVPIEYEAICETAFGSYSVGQKISNTEYEALPNEQRHYTRVELDADANTAYIVVDNFTLHGVPYSKGQIVDKDTYDAINDNSRIVSKTFDVAGSIYYYCYEDYSSVTKGTVITETEYNMLPNEQKNFIIQGQEPVETSTLYVSNESEILDVSKERIYTIVYQYTYYENEDRNNVKFNNELHVINVHVQMVSGVPVIGPITPPDVIMPGTAISMNAPDVTVGSYLPLDNGWEIYSNEQDAKLHRNGVPYENGVDPLYWYQNGNYYINYYSRNYLGKMYSPNPVPLKVANYHDLDAVMKDKEHHMYVDQPDVERPSKIYIDNRSCQSDNTKSELDLLKDFFDLSLQTTTASTGETAGHNLLNSHVHGARNLDFILQSDVSPKKYTTWTSIGGNNNVDNPNTDDADEALPNGQCFEGNLHGDGHTISGLTSSLFAHFCGEAYNLGVTGSFATSGIADEGSGYLENCWVKSSNTTDAKTSKPIFGNPITDSWSGARTIHMVNCYYPSENKFTSHGSASYGLPIEKPLKAFYDGEVTYNLNGFYLFKRYCDNKPASGNKYSYYLKTLTGAEGEKKNDNGSLSLNTNGHYESKNGPYLMNDYDGNYVGSYVESRYADGDFRYASGNIPSAKNERIYTDTIGDKKEHFYPIWPDDYIFFGQALTYNHVSGKVHQAEPCSVSKLGGLLVDTKESNRVFRAPAYFGNNIMSTAYFNKNAVFAQSNKKLTDNDVDTVAYRGMTAIDFSGYNGGSYQYGQTAGGFYPPLLDDDGITDFINVDLTRNLLVYTNSAMSAETENTVKTKLIEEDYQEINSDYHTVAEANNLRQEKTVRGHWVQLGESGYKAVRDHYLVDKEEFNAPIAYSFDDNYRMWYQRIPENYVGKKKANKTGFVDKTAGWEGISLPFTAEIVTTNTKGEITHFYDYADNDENHSSGHEYWLRMYNGKKEGTTITDSIFVADFRKPAAGTTSKVYTNTFLWDYYYSINNSSDMNSDKYPGSYYNSSHNYTNYPRLANATPYIIGFPGERYYEFDLSGNYEAKTALVTPTKLPAQIITFASATGAHIDVSDVELAANKADGDGYTFMPNYGNKKLTDVAYILNTNAATDDTSGSSYTIADNAVLLPFRPYFKLTDTAGARKQSRSIVFADEQTNMEVHNDDIKNDTGLGLNIYAKSKKIVVESNLREIATLRIVNAEGITICSFTIKPGESIETPISNSGVYVVQTIDGNYKKKLAVK